MLAYTGSLLSPTCGGESGCDLQDKSSTHLVKLPSWTLLTSHLLLSRVRRVLESPLYSIN